MIPTEPQTSRTALIVEDEPLVRMFLESTLTDFGFKVIETDCADAGLKAAKNERTIEVAIVDVGLPDRSGIDLARELRRDCPTIKIVIASGYGDRLAESLRNDPNITFVSKPYNSDGLQEAFARLNLPEVATS